MNKVLSERKTIRLPNHAYLGRQMYFATLCCFQKHPLSDAKLCATLLGLLSSEATSRDFSIPAYCFMPDHFHFLAEGCDAGPDFLRFLKSFKIKSNRSYPRLAGNALWQRRFFDHVLRPTESVEDFAWYIWLNPVRAGLVKTAEEYPLSGSLSGMKMPAVWTTLDWRPRWKRVASSWVGEPPRKAVPT